MQGQVCHAFVDAGTERHCRAERAPAYPSPAWLPPTPGMQCNHGMPTFGPRRHPKPGPLAALCGAAPLPCETSRALLPPPQCFAHPACPVCQAPPNNITSMHMFPDQISPSTLALPSTQSSPCLYFLHVQTAPRPACILVCPLSFPCQAPSSQRRERCAGVARRADCCTFMPGWGLAVGSPVWRTGRGS